VRRLHFGEKENSGVLSSPFNYSKVELRELLKV
jgi:hypothetical protein